MEYSHISDMSIAEYTLLISQPCSIEQDKDKENFSILQIFFVKSLDLLSTPIYTEGCNVLLNSAHMIVKHVHLIFLMSFCGA